MPEDPHTQRSASRPAPADSVREAAAGDEHVKAQYEDSAFYEYRARFLRHLIMALPMPGIPAAPARSCLDIGCNMGRFTAMLAQRGFATRGLDYAPALVAEARALHPTLAFENGDAQALSHPSASFDCVTAFGVIQGVPDWRRVVAEALRVLKPGGVAMFETNRALPFWEIAIKSAVYLGRRQLGTRETWELYRAHRMAASRPVELGFRRFMVRDLMACVDREAVGRVIVHDPLKHGLFHDSLFAVALVKRDGRACAGRPEVTRCDVCRRHGIAGMGLD